MSTRRAVSTAVTALFVCSLALTGCNNAETGADTPKQGGATFDLSTVQKDDALAALVPQALREKGKMVVGMDTSYAPAEYLGADGQTPIGYDVDLVKAIGAVLDLQVDPQTASFPSILPSIGTKYDLSASSFFITNERKKSATFVSYIAAGTQWGVQKGNPSGFSLENACGRTVAVQTGSFQETKDLVDRNKACAEAGKPEIKVISLKNQSDVTTRLVTGGADAMAAGSITTAYAATQTDGAVEALGDSYDASPVGIAVALDNPELADVIAKAVNKLMADGAYLKILEQWGVGNIAIDKAEVNPDVQK